MKSPSIVVTCIATTVVSTAAAFAAPARASGIYLTAQDYIERRISFEGDCTSTSHKLELHDVLGKAYIHVTHGTETRKYAKNELYGFQACPGREYRFVNNREYQILESRQMSVYAIQVPGRVNRRAYFFSAGPGGKLVPLTRKNVKLAFPDNHAFHDALDQMFHSDEALRQYDDVHKMFKVNRLLITSAATDQ